MNPTNRIVLTPEQEKWLVAHFPTTYNDVCAEHLGISKRTVNRIASRLGLVKTRAFVRKCQREAASAALYLNRLHGRFPAKGTIPPNSEKYRFGQPDAYRPTKAQRRKMVAKAVATRERRREEDRRRVAMGLKPKTKLLCTSRPKGEAQTRYYLTHVCRYMADGFDMYWDENTRRSRKHENNQESAFRFHRKGE